MCFSAPVSFAASAALAAAGGLTLRKARTREEMPFAAIPLLFAVQQFIEGMLWLELPHAGFAPYWLTQAYVVFVGMVWPVLIPLGLSLIEPDRLRKRLMQAILLLGAAVAMYTADVIARYGVSASIVNECIVYQYPGDDRPGILAVYFVATCMAFFFSGHRNLRWIGAANVAGFLVAYYFYRFSYASTWCFFAALISGLIYEYFRRLREREGNYALATHSSPTL